MKKVAPIKPPISLDVLDKMDIRVGTIELVGDVHVYPMAHEPDNSGGDREFL